MHRYRTTPDGGRRFELPEDGEAVARRRACFSSDWIPKKFQKKFLTAHSVDAMLSVINASLVEVVNTQQSGEAGAIRKQGKASRGSRQ
jgi:hypothetical protein